MRITIVGSGTVVPHPERVCAAYFVEVSSHRLLFDCGPGALHHLARFRLPWSELTGLAISHFHNDHVGDVPALLFSLKHGLPSQRRDELRVFGPPGTARLFARMAAAFGDHVRDPGFPIPILETVPAEPVNMGGAVQLSVRPTPHTDASLAYRLDTPDAALGYTGDTGPDPGLGDFFQGVDVLIAECSLPDEHAMDTHLTPSRVATIAAAARPRQLVLTHVYPQLEQQDLEVLLHDAGWDGTTRVAIDGMQLVL